MVGACNYSAPTILNQGEFVSMKRNKTFRSMKINGLPWILPAFIFLVGLIYFSIIYTFNLSTLDWNGLDPVPIQVGLGNYTKLFSDWIFWRAIQNTIFYFIVTFVIQNFLGFIFAAILQIGRAHV